MPPRKAAATQLVERSPTGSEMTHAIQRFLKAEAAYKEAYEAMLAAREALISCMRRCGLEGLHL
jgi:hypothetical protein